MIRPYRIEYLNDDGTGERIERAYSADDAIVQFKVYAEEHLQRAIPTKIEPVEEGVLLAKKGLPFGGALYWLRMGAKVRRPCWGVGYLCLQGETLRMYCSNNLTVDFGDATAGAEVSAALLATDWEVVS